MSYPVRRPSASRPVVVGAYHGRGDGRLRADLPSSCPRQDTDGQACRVAVNHHRDRKTGPKHPVLVAECRTHDVAFTVYPPGHVPYGRVPVLHVAPDGKEIQREKDIPQSERYHDTVFEASLDAGAGRQWGRAELHDAGPWWNTQVRHLAIAESLLGLSPQQSEEERERIATALEVPLLDLRCGAKAIARTPGYRSRGAATLHVLQFMAGQPCVLERLMLGGHRAGLWGVPYFWDRASGCLRTPAFPVHAARASPPPC